MWLPADDWEAHIAVVSHFANATRVTAMTLGIPTTSFREHVQKALLWADSDGLNGGDQNEAAGRFGSIQLRKFDFANRLAPSDRPLHENAPAPGGR